MAEWSIPKTPNQFKRITRAAKRVVPREESGQACPRCGDLWPWHAERCASCGARLR